MMTNKTLNWWIELSQEERFAIIIKAHRELRTMNKETNTQIPFKPPYIAPKQRKANKGGIL